MKNKILKIIQVVYDILSLGFIIFISVALAVTPKVEGQAKQESPSSLIYEKKQKQNIYRTDNGIIYGIGTDIGGGTFFEGFATYIKDTYGYNILVAPTFSASSSSLMNGSQPLFRVAEWNKTDFENPSNSITYQTIYGFSLYFTRNAPSSGYIDYDSNLGNGYKARIYHLVLKFVDVNGSEFANTYLTYDIIYTFDRSNTAVAYVPYLIDVVNADTYFAIWDTQHINNTLIVDMVNGGAENSNYLYQQGYSKGYIAGSSGLNANVFTTMGQAFSAVSNIFSIELIPGFPLWVLVFAPLVVTIVIVVVKMIKG